MAKMLAGLSIPIGYTVLWLIVAAITTIWWQTQAAGAGRRSTGSTTETATGLAGLGRVRLLEPPHTGSNYLLREMAYEIARTRAYQLRLIAGVAGFAVPFLLVFISLLVGPIALLLALLSHLAGIMALRWLFFAEAEHVQALYYGRT